MQNNHLKDLIKNLPDEIKIHIFDYEHLKRKSLNACLPFIRLHGCKFRIEFLNKRWMEHKSQNDHHILSFYDVLNEYVDDPEHIIHTLSQCNCCSRHIKHRPCNLQCTKYNEYIQRAFLPKGFEFKPTCECDCRHMCRLIHEFFS